MVPGRGLDLGWMEKVAGDGIKVDDQTRDVPGKER